MKTLKTNKKLKFNKVNTLSTSLLMFMVIGLSGCGDRRHCDDKKVTLDTSDDCSHNVAHGGVFPFVSSSGTTTRTSSGYFAPSTASAISEAGG